MKDRNTHYVKSTQRVHRFVEGVSAAVLRLNQAYEKRSAIEAVVLSAVLIDATLRIGLLMHKQLEQKTNEVDESFVYQANADKMISERNVMKLARSANILTEIQFHELESLYDMRNKCVHRYVISDINYEYMTQLVFAYAEAMDFVNNAVRKIEKMQLEAGCGIVVATGDKEKANYEQIFLGWCVDMAKTKERRPNTDG